ncbi:MAG: DUF1800 domain-containing protein [Chloroflexi bacterium]|nr:DUF1800 domain-containing protein [Chloroflexota bacterium]
MSTNDTALIAHLMRRAGFGARFDEIEALAAKGYDATVDWLLNPVGEPETDDDITLRFTPMHVEPQGFAGPASRWLYRILNTRRPLEEKMTLFWHCVFATGFSKLNSGTAMWRQYEMLHAYAMGNFRDLLLQLSKDPAMIYWLDNCDNHDGTPNENYGRELMELFSMGIGNYTEDDVKTAARAFTGWTYTDPLPRVPYLFYHPSFEYREWDHDGSEKTFLGETGNFNGEDIIDIIVKQPATGQFLARHLYNFFVADEPQVPAWPYTPPNDPDAVNTLAQAYIDSGYEMRSVLETLFKSDFFKEARFKKVKSPLELVSNTVRMTGDFNVEMGTFPKHGLTGLAATVGFMGQQVFNPPSVEGWHTGKEWIDSGALVQRVNFAAEQVGDAGMPGVRLMLDKLADDTASMSPEGFVDGCLRLMGDLELEADTHSALVQHVAGSGALRADTAADRDRFDARATEMMQLIVATPEYQSE